MAVITSLPVPQEAVEFDNVVNFVFVERPPLDVGLEVVQPPQAAALPAPS